VHDRRRELDQHRGSAHARGYDARWAKARLTYIAEHPTCAHCALQGRTTAATLVDHIVPHHGDQELFWLVANWQALCASCHQVKGILESGLRPCAHEAEPERIKALSACPLCGSITTHERFQEDGANLAE
jgi:5-methylcytosine-specific restriction protein A